MKKYIKSDMIPQDRYSFEGNKTYNRNKKYIVEWLGGYKYNSVVDVVCSDDFNVIIDVADQGAFAGYTVQITNTQTGESATISPESWVRGTISDLCDMLNTVYDGDLYEDFFASE